MTLVCFAVPQELAFFRRQVRNRIDIRLLITGMGRLNTERAFRQELRAKRPKCVLTCGFAGGLNPAFARDTVLLHGEDHFPFHASLLRAGALPARFHCAPAVATTAAAKAELRRLTNADAVEMESEAIRSICQDQGLPSATVRVISDAADEDLPLDFNKLLTRSCRMNYPALAATLLLSPSKIPRLIRFQKNLQKASARLGCVLAQALSCPLPTGEP